MDWVIVASGVVSLLTWFVTKTGESLAQKAGGQLFDLLKQKFKKDKEANNTLEYFAKNPERYKNALTDIVKDKATSDSKFGEKLLSIVDESRKFLTNEGVINQTAIGNGNAQVIGNQSSASVILGKSEQRKKR